MTITMTISHFKNYFYKLFETKHLPRENNVALENV
jgi:hypothetical protein